MKVEFEKAMRIIIASIGRMKAGNEREMLERYIDRVTKSGKSLGINDVQCIEISESRASSDKLRKEEEAGNLLSAIPSPNFLVALDERGESITSTAFAKLIGQQISEGHGRLVFAIGGADGLSQKITEGASRILAFGAMTWPHQFARIMLAEQIYRASTILSGHPYHRN